MNLVSSSATAKNKEKNPSYQLSGRSEVTQSGKNPHTVKFLLFLTGKFAFFVEKEEKKRRFWIHPVGTVGISEPRPVPTVFSDVGGTVGPVSFRDWLTPLWAVKKFGKINLDPLISQCDICVLCGTTNVQSAF